MNRNLNWLIIICSCITAWVLMRIPLPKSIDFLRPDWMMLIFIFWSLKAPEKVSVTFAFFVGLLLDVLTGSLLGQYALTFTFLTYLAQLFKNRYRLFTSWQQGFLVLMLIGSAKFTLLTIHWILGHPPITIWYFATIITSIIVWPFLNRFLRIYV